VQDAQHKKEAEALFCFKLLYFSCGLIAVSLLTHECLQFLLKRFGHARTPHRGHEQGKAFNELSLTSFTVRVTTSQSWNINFTTFSSDQRARRLLVVLKHLPSFAHDVFRWLPLVCGPKEICRIVNRLQRERALWVWANSSCAFSVMKLLVFDIMSILFSRKW